MARRADYVIENADIRWRNFSERVSAYSKFDKARSKSDPRSIYGGSFAIFLPAEIADDLKEKNVKVEEYVNKRDPNEEPLPFIRVSVQFDPDNTWKDPTIWQITEDGSRVRLDEDTMANLDYAVITKADITLNFGKTPGPHGRKVYLNTAYITIEQSDAADLAAKYGY